MERSEPAFFTRMGMPETSVNEDDPAQAREYQIGAAWKFAPVQTKTEA
jgi:hypothetical protein